MTGHTNNPNGRPKGSKNKATADLRLFITNFIDRNAEAVQQSFDELDAKSKLQMFERFCSYVLPKPQSIDLTAEVKTNDRLLRPQFMSDEELEAEIKRLRMADSDDDEKNITDPKKRAELDFINAEIERLKAVGVEK